MINEDMQLVFENCEFAHIKKEQVETLRLGGITQDIIYSPMGRKVTTTAKSLYLVVRNPEQKLVERCFKWQDITYLAVGCEEYRIEWGKGSCEQENLRQRCHRHRDGHLVIQVKM